MTSGTRGADIVLGAAVIAMGLLAVDNPAFPGVLIATYQPKQLP
jgi:hypothetical protein